MFNNKNLFNSKTAKGLVSFATIIVLLSSILATSFFYENSITANVIREDSSNLESAATITEVDDINDLSQLNEGWYEVRKGFVFYLDTFNSYVPLYIKVLNAEQQNGLVEIDENVTTIFSQENIPL